MKVRRKHQKPGILEGHALCCVSNYIHNTRLGCLHGDIHLRSRRLWIAPSHTPLKSKGFILGNLCGVDKPKAAPCVIVTG